MYYRRKLVLALIGAAGKSLGKTDLQKWVFLFTRRQATPAYDFFPYRYGCFSSVLDHDLEVMQRQGLVQKSDDGWRLIADADFSASLLPSDRAILHRFLQEFRTLRGRELLRYVYTHFPYYAINSEIRAEVLSEQENATVEGLRRRQSEPALFTIGYEGQTPEAFINTLIQRDVQILCDVRKNAYSRKHGFSQRQLDWLTCAVGIEYVHLPGLGIESHKRKNLLSRQDYETLFDEYDQTVLRANVRDLKIISTWIRAGKRVALTCFEADHRCCHRSRVALALQKLIPDTVPMEHL